MRLSAISFLWGKEERYRCIGERASLSIIWKDADGHYLVASASNKSAIDGKTSPLDLIDDVQTGYGN
jgi:hypothetical protein